MSTDAPNISAADANALLASASALLRKGNDVPLHWAVGPGLGLAEAWEWSTDPELLLELAPTFFRAPLIITAAARIARAALADLPETSTYAARSAIAAAEAWARGEQSAIVVLVATQAAIRDAKKRDVLTNDAAIALGDAVDRIGYVGHVAKHALWEAKDVGDYELRRSHYSDLLHDHLRGHEVTLEKLVAAVQSR